MASEREAAWSAYRAARAAAHQAHAEEHRARAAAHAASAAEQRAYERVAAAEDDPAAEGWARGRRSWYLEAAQDCTRYAADYERMAAQVAA